MTEPWENVVAVVLVGLQLVAIFGLIGFSIYQTWKVSRRK